MQNLFLQHYLLCLVIHVAINISTIPLDKSEHMTNSKHQRTGTRNTSGYCRANKCRNDKEALHIYP